MRKHFLIWHSSKPLPVQKGALTENSGKIRPSEAFNNGVQISLKRKQTGIFFPELLFAGSTGKCLFPHWIHTAGQIDAGQTAATFESTAPNTRYTFRYGDGDEATIIESAISYKSNIVTNSDFAKQTVAKPTFIIPWSRRNNAVYN